MSQPPDTSPAPHPLLDVRRLSVRFGHKQVVQDVDLRIGFGEKVALVGESGSGKTVTALSLLRLLTHAEVQGQALFAARAGASPADLLQLPERQLRAVRGGEIAMIFQEPMTALNPLMTIGAQIAEVLLLKRGMNRTQALTEAIALLERTGLPEPARRAQAYPHQLSGGQRQRAMIAMALAGHPALLLADEPTTALDVTIRGQILDLLDDLQQQNGMAVLMITHDLLMVQRFAQRIIVMENGRVVEQGLVSEVFANPQHPYTRKLLASMPERNVVERPDVAPEAVAAIHAQNLCISYPVSAAGVKGWFRKDDFVAVRDASLQLRPAHTLGVVGESGSGKSTLAQAILGLLPFGGELRINGQHWQCSKHRGALANTPHNKALRREIQVVFQDPFSSLSPRMTVEEIVEEGLRVHEPALDAAARRQRVLDVLGEVGLGEAQFPGLLSRYPHEFSGGQRQRLAVARALILHPRVLVLDEPTSALDVTIQKQVLSLLQRLQKEMGLAYLLITHDVDVIRAMAHDVLVMKDSRIVESGPVRQVLDNPQMAYTRELVSAAGLRTND